MKVRKTFAALFATVCSVVFVLLVTVFVAAACSEKVTLRFETGSGTHIASVEGQVGGEYEKPQDPSLDGYYFDGWFLDPSYSGEPQSLPDVMPAESTTYYAKYEKCPVLTLCSDGGAELMRLEVKPGVELSTRLKGLAPEKEGLIFGGWARDGEVLPQDAVMGTEDMTLTACYKARYTVDVFLQDADDPVRYERDAHLSYEGADWAESEFSADTAAPAHFLFLPERSSSEGVLHAGGNAFSLYFDREAFTVTLDPALPEGGGEPSQIPSRYGAHLALVQPEGGEGFTFLGWRAEDGDHGAGETLVLTQALSFKGIWATAYKNALGEGTLYAELGQGPVRRALYEVDGERYEGEFDETRGTFSAGGYRGKLEPHGGFLPDNSGTYRESVPNGNRQSQTGELTLDFFGGRAAYTRGELSLEGAYAPLYDDAADCYTGEYSLEGGFNFRLYDTVFLREGEEKGSYARYDLSAEDLCGGTLTLDGYGNAVLIGEKTQTGHYFRGETDWCFLSQEGEESHFLLGGRSWDGIAEEDAFLLWEERLYGVYHGEGTLTLDGYGLCARLREAEEERTAAFVRERDVVTLFCEPVLRFTLHGDSFLPTSEEEGLYEGEFGELYLDGAGGAHIGEESAPKDSGSYEVSGESYVYEGGSKFRFRLREERYEVYHEANAGTFMNYFYETALILDGFGGGKCFLTAGDGFDVSLLYRDEGFLLLSSDAFHSPRKTAAFRIDGEGVIAEIPSFEAGLFPVYAGGKRTGETLLLDGMGGARLLGGAAGEYVYSHAKRETVCNFGGESRIYRLSEQGGEFCVELSLFAGEYGGEAGTLCLDGYGGATLAGEKVAYLVKNGQAELDLGEELLRFDLKEGGYVLTRFRRYTSPFGTEILYLGQDSMEAILRDGEEFYGTYGLDIFLSSGRSFAFRTKGDEFFRYDAESAGTLLIADGGTLTLDGCGFGTLVRGDAATEGRALLCSGYVLFFSEEISLGFRLEGGVLTPLDGECGMYRSALGGETICLCGDGSLALPEGEIIGSYVKISDDVYEISLHGKKSHIRISREEHTWAQWEETLEGYEGSYSVGGNTLLVDGCSVTLVAGGTSVSYRFLCACEGGFLAQNTATGESFRFRFGRETEILPVSSRFFVREI